MCALLLLLWLGVNVLGANVPANTDLWKARDDQDRAALARIAAQRSSAAEKAPADAAAQYQAALAQSTLAEIATELRDKDLARKASDAGIAAAERAVGLDPKRSEYHRIHGTLCGQAAAAHGHAEQEGNPSMSPLRHFCLCDCLCAYQVE